MFKEIDYLESNCFIDIGEMAKNGTIYIVRNYIPLKQFLETLDFKNFNEIKYDEINTNSLVQFSKKLSEYKNNGIFSILFSSFLNKYELHYDHSYIDLGNPRIVLPEKILNKSIKSGNIWNNPQSCFVQNLSPPHRDLNRPHYNRQYNFWFGFHKIKKQDSLVFFPDAFKKQIFPYMGNKHLDCNADAKDLSFETRGYSYNDYKLGNTIQAELDPGDFLFFNSEHYHCSAKKVENVRISCEVRYTDKSFDDNTQYKKDSFLKTRNQKFVDQKSLYSSFLEFDDYSVYKQKSIFKEFEDDLKIKLLLQDKLKYKLSFFQKLKMVLSIKSFYFLEQIQTMNEFKVLRKLIKFRLKKLSNYFMKNDFDFSSNPVNYFKKGHHPFVGKVPSLKRNQIEEIIKEISIKINSK